MSEVAAPLPEPLRQALDREARRRGRVAPPVYYCAEAGSTNDVAARLALAGAAAGTAVLAAAQTAGRGRRGRHWHSPPGSGLYFSVVCRPRESAGRGDEGGVGLAAPQVSLLTLMAGEAVADGIARATGLELALKWPNDLVVERGAPAGTSRWRKAGGILAEASVAGHRLQHVIVGVGINVNAGAYPPELRDRATSLETELGHEVDAAEVFAHCLAALDRGQQDLNEGRAQEVLERWRRRAPSAMGRRITWEGPNGRRPGVTRGVDETGALLVEHDGQVDRVIAGEVSWL